jgi:hypothetical protein
MLTKGSGTDDPDQPEAPHLTSSPIVARMTQVVREDLMAIPRRGLSDGTEGKKVLPFKSILQQASDTLQTPLIKGGVVSPGAQGSAAFPKTTEVEEAELIQYAHDMEVVTEHPAARAGGTRINHLIPCQDPESGFAADGPPSTMGQSPLDNQQRSRPGDHGRAAVPA